MIKMRLLEMVLVMLCGLVGFACGYQAGRTSLMNDIILEKCWLNKQSRDIECITYMGD